MQTQIQMKRIKDEIDFDGVQQVKKFFKMHFLNRKILQKKKEKI